MKYLKFAMLAVAMIFASPVFAQAPAGSCISMEQFQAEVVKQDPTYKMIILSGGPLEQFAANMDKLSGGGHGPMDGLVFMDPDGNQNPVTIIAVFKDHCYVGNASAPTEMVKKALGSAI